MCEFQFAWITNMASRPPCWILQK